MSSGPSAHATTFAIGGAPYAEQRVRGVRLSVLEQDNQPLVQAKLLPRAWQARDSLVAHSIDTRLRPKMRRRRPAMLCAAPLTSQVHLDLVP